MRPLTISRGWTRYDFSLSLNCSSPPPPSIFPPHPPFPFLSSLSFSSLTSCLLRYYSPARYHMVRINRSDLANAEEGSKCDYISFITRKAKFEGQGRPKTRPILLTSTPPRPTIGHHRPQGFLLTPTTHTHTIPLEPRFTELPPPPPNFTPNTIRLGRHKKPPALALRNAASAARRARSLRAAGPRCLPEKQPLTCYLAVIAV